MKKEVYHISAAIILLSIVSGFFPFINGMYSEFGLIFLFSIIIISANILAKKFTANLLDASVEHEILFAQRYGFKPHHRLKKPIPIGIILPLIVTLFSLGVIKLMTFLTYETAAKKVRAAKRFGYYSYTEMTDWHNGLIGSSGVVALIILAVISYLSPYAALETLSKMSIYYAFWNLIPAWKLDGTQIFFGSRMIWTVLAATTAVLTAIAIII